MATPKYISNKFSVLNTLSKTSVNRTSAIITLSAVMLTACQSYSTAPSTSTTVTASKSSTPTILDLTEPVADTGISVQADSSFPVIELMPFIIKQQKALGLNNYQVQAFATYRKAVMKQRMALQSNEKALRGQLRKALIEGADVAVTNDLMERISQTELMHMQLRRNCIENVRKVLSKEQYDKLIDMYIKSLTL